MAHSTNHPKMKNLVHKTTFLLLAVLFLNSAAEAQTSRFGNTPEDSINCVRNYSLYREYARQGNVDQALPFWRIVFVNYPRAFKTTYIDGARIMEAMFENTSDPKQKLAYFDTLMLVYDRRMENFGERPLVLGQKGVMFLKHKNDIEEAMTGYKYLEEAISLGNINPQVLTVFMNVTVNLFSTNLLPADKVIENYLKLTEIIDRVLTKDPQGNMAQVKEYVENFFEISKAADCNSLIEIFAPQVKANPNDIDLIAKVNKLLGNSDCTDAQLFVETSEKLHRVNPTASTAYNLSRMYRAKNDFRKASDYLLEAISLQTDHIEKSNYYLELATFTYRDLKNLRLGREYALKAIEANSKNGHAYMVIGNIYASDKDCLEDDFAKKAIYWIVVDKYVQAKNADPSLAEEANRLIDIYSVYFPDNEMIFFYGYSVGDTYTFNCWFNEKTRVRTN
jgi:tetratricopeptide (TPR) repeat protein